MRSADNRFMEFWRSQRERGAQQRRADQLRLDPSQLKLLLSNTGIRAELQNSRMASLLPPVGKEVFRRPTPASLEETTGRSEVTETDRSKAAVHLETGKPLPFVYGSPSPQLLNTPLEELDPFYQSQKTFIVLDKGNIIHRFNADSSCYLLSLFHPVRTIAIKVLLSSWFPFFILLATLANLIYGRYIFIIFTAEVMVKVMSRGFCIGHFTFLRDPWNWLDLMVIASGLLFTFLDLDEASVLITVSSCLKLIAVFPGMRQTAGALVQSLKHLAGVFILTLSGLSILALIALHLFKGNLSQKCVMRPIPSNETDNSFNFTTDTEPASYYYLPDLDTPLLCGYSSTAGICPEGYTCRWTMGNPNYGFTNFDSFGWSLLSMFRLMTQDYWENLFQMVLRTTGKDSAIVFAFIFFPGCFCLVSLILAAVTMWFVEKDKADVTEAKLKEDEFLHILEVLGRKEEKEEQTSGGDSLPQETSSPADRKGPEQAAEPEQNHGSCSVCWFAFANCCLKWNCCSCWRWLKQRLQAFVKNPFFDLGVVICIVLNVFFTAMNHYPRTEGFETMRALAEMVFTMIFLVEVILRILAMDPYDYFKVGWNIFDFIIISLSVLGFVMDSDDVSPSLRVFRLGRWWATFNLWMKVVWASMKTLRNLTLILFIVVFMFSTVGFQLFGSDYINNVYRITTSSLLPRWHQGDFFHAFLVNVRILCGEWIETLWDCMEVSGQTTCQTFYFMVVIVGNLLVLNLFLALMLSSLHGDFFVPAKKSKNNLQIAFNQIKNALRTRTCRDPKAVDSEKDQACVALDVVTSDQGVGCSRAPIAEIEPELKMDENGKEAEKEQECGLEQKQDKGNEKRNRPEACCCDSCYRCCPLLEVDTSQGTGRNWANFRAACLLIVEHKYFEVLIIFIILLSSVALVFEDVHLQKSPDIQDALDKADQVFACLFLLEMVMKWIALGLKNYFSRFWCWLDFLILAVSLMGITGGMLGWTELGAGLSLRTLRTLRPLRTLSRFQGPRAVLEALAVSLTSMLNVLLVSLVVWLFFSITGVEMFAGKFSYCYNGTSNVIFFHETVANKSECFSLFRENSTDVRWINPYVNFNNVAIGYLALLQVATFKGWLEVMYSAVDTRLVEDQRQFEGNLYMYMYFIIFIFFGGFFIFSFFFRVFIDVLDQQRHKFGGKHFFMTEEQQKYSRVLVRMFFKTPDTGPRPQNQCLARLFDLVTNPYFEVFMVVLIFLNMVSLMVETDYETTDKAMILFWFEIFFILVFFLEFLLKISALRKHYFSSGWNVVDFVVLVVSFVGLFFAELLKMFVILRLVLLCPLFRLARVCRILHLFHCTRRIRALLVAFLMSLPALFNICFHLFVLMFTYSIFGMINFAYVKKEAMLDDMLNFETFANSIICMFVITTRAGWDGVLTPLLNSEPDCDPDFENPGSTIRGNCVSQTVGIIFCTSYILLSLLLIVQLYIAVILEAFNTNDTETLSDNDLQMFYKTWMKFDPSASQVIQYSQLSDLCDCLQDPLRIPKANAVKLAQMHLPRLSGDKVHCLDVLVALTAQAFGQPAEREALKARLEEKSKTNSCPSKHLDVAEGLTEETRVDACV